MEPKNAKNALCIGALDLQRLKCRQQNLPQKGCNCLEGSNVRTLRCSNLEPMVPQKDALPISPTCSLFVFPINGLKQNARSLLTTFSDTDFYPLLNSFHFVLHGSSDKHLFQRL